MEIYKNNTEEILNALLIDMSIGGKFGRLPNLELLIKDLRNSLATLNRERDAYTVVIANITAYHADVKGRRSEFLPNPNIDPVINTLELQRQRLNLKGQELHMSLGLCKETHRKAKVGKGREQEKQLRKIISDL